MQGICLFLLLYLIVSQYRCVFLDFTYSASSPSSPTLFRFVMLLDAFSIYSVLKGVFISADFMIVGSSIVTVVNMFLKCSDIQFQVFIVSTSLSDFFHDIISVFVNLSEFVFALA